MKGWVMRGNKVVLQQGQSKENSFNWRFYWRQINYPEDICNLIVEVAIQMTHWDWDSWVMTNASVGVTLNNDVLRLWGFCICIMSFIVVRWCQFSCLTGTQGDVNVAIRKAFRVLLNMAGGSTRWSRQTLTFKWNSRTSENTPWNSYEVKIVRLEC